SAGVSLAAIVLQAEPAPRQRHHHHAAEPQPQLQAQWRERSVLAASKARPYGVGDGKIHDDGGAAENQMEMRGDPRGVVDHRIHQGTRPAEIIELSTPSLNHGTSASASALLASFVSGSTPSSRHNSG